MRNLLSIALLILALGIGIRALAQTVPPSTSYQSGAATIATPAMSPPQPGETASPTMSTESLLIPIIDSSPSVRGYWKEMKRSAKQIIQSAPDQAAVALVGIDAEAVKSQVFAPSRKADAIAFVDSLKIGGNFTDLGRGADAALAVAQQANPSRCVLVFLTDGRMTVPKTFRDKSTFYDLLRREFTARSNVTVLIVNVRGDKSAERESLPQNVKIFSLKSADELRAMIERTLAPTIKQTLTVEIPTAPSVTTKPPDPPARSKRVYLMGGLGAGLLLIIAIAVVARKRARNKRMSEIADDAPANLLQPEDLVPSEPETMAEPVALVTAERVDERTGHRTFAQHSIVRAGGHIVIGNSSFADLILEGLKQSQSLQIGFDGKAVRVYRLRPHGIGELDNVRLNQQPAPIQFNMTERDAVIIGSLSIKLLITTEDAAPSSLVRSETASRLKPDQANHATSRRVVGSHMRDN